MFLNSHKVRKVHFQPFQAQMDQGSILPRFEYGTASSSSENGCQVNQPQGKRRIQVDATIRWFSTEASRKSSLPSKYIKMKKKPNSRTQNKAVKTE